MSVHLPLKDMTLKEKLEILEVLWEDLARSAQSVESPDWHKKTLEQRGERVAEGKARFTDWETAKAEIRGKN
jgi:Putative addiction module component